MNRLLARLLVAGVFMAIGGVWYLVSDVTDCSGPKSDAWAEASLDRLDEADADYQSFDEYTTAGEFAAFAQRAEARYQAQLAEATISCLEGIHEQMVAFFFYEMEMYKAASAGNWDAADTYDQQSVAAMERIVREYGALAEKYNWDTE